MVVGPLSPYIMYNIYLCYLYIYIYGYICIWANNFMTPTYRPHLLDVVDVRINFPKKLGLPGLDWCNCLILEKQMKHLSHFWGQIIQLTCSEYICLRNVLSIIRVFVVQEFSDMK